MDWNAVQGVLDAAVSAGEVPGVAAAVVDAGGMVAEAFAVKTMLGGDAPVTEETVFWIASMTKPITSVAAMQLVEEGRLALDAPVGDVLPELAHPKVLEGGRLRAAKRAMTLRQLMMHTAGFTYPFMSAELTQFIAAQPEGSLPAPNTRAALEAPLLFEPGDRWEYGISTDWVGLAVEAVSGMTLDRYFEAHIFAPLGMTETGFRLTDAQKARQVMVHHRGADGRLAPGRAVRPFAEHYCSGGGGLFSTIRDYPKFLRVFLERGAGVISPGSVEAMTRNQIGGLRAGFMPSANPSLMAGRDVNSGMQSKWGLGFLIYPENGQFGRNAGSYGWSGMANTYFWVDPVAQLAVVIMMQVLPSGDAGAIRTLNRLERAIYGAW